MLFKRIESKGIAHFSYLLGDKGDAVVIDPRRDCEIYLDLAHPEGMRIRHVVETHRHEDYIVGSVELAARTGAEVWRADSHLEYSYGNPVEDGRKWKVGRFELTAMHTPGHTPGSMSYLFTDPDGRPLIAFTGDLLFMGDTGRVDLLGEDKMFEMAGMMFDSIYNKILPLDDGVVLAPAHGSGSVCGESIAERPLTTVGIERASNPRLSITDREEFVGAVSRMLERPPYFRRMEKLNLQRPEALHRLPKPAPLSPDDFLATMKARNAVVVDTRLAGAFGASHVPGALSLWEDGMPQYAGWLLEYERPVLLVADSDDVEDEVRYLVRFGYEEGGGIAGYLAGGMLSWEMEGMETGAIKTLSVNELCRILDEKRQPYLLDVRKADELETGKRIAGAVHIPITELKDRMYEVPLDREVFIFCGSGLRSMTAASILKKSGWERLNVTLGGLSAWSSISCPLES